MTLRNIKLILSYDGTNYYGFQSQVSGNTIQDFLLKAIQRIMKNKPIIYCAGRTDSGVHAQGQIVNFFTAQLNLNEDSWVKAINSMLPNDIRVLSCEFVNEDFNARKNAIFREYWYRIINANTISALDNRYSLHYNYPINIDLLNEYCEVLLGEHDFSSFCASTDTNESKSRFIHYASADRNGDLVIIKIAGNAFLHRMVRSIVGTMLLLQRFNKPSSAMKSIIEAKDRKLAGSTVSAKGLVFQKVYYS